MLDTERDLNLMTTVVFIPGFRKPPTDFNVTDAGKYIGIVNCISKRAPTLEVNLQLEDYLKPLDEVCSTIHDQILTPKCLLVAQSYGGFFALRYAELYTHTVCAVVLLDISIKSEEYRAYLAIKYASEADPLTAYKLEHFDVYPDSVLDPQIIAHVYAPVLTPCHTRLLGTHPESKFIPATCHMVHYKQAAEVIRSIRELLTVSKKRASPL